MFMKEKDKSKNVNKEGERGEEKKREEEKKGGKRKGRGILQIRVGVVSLILKMDFLKF